MTTGAIYARVSTESQEEEGTIESQILALRKKALELKLEVPASLHFTDNGFSGSRMDRPALDALRDAASEGRFQLLLVHDADRLARNFVHQEIILEELERYGISVEFIESRHSTRPEDRLLSQVKGVFAEYERAKIMERTRRGKLHRAMYQGWTNWTVPPYGYSVVRTEGGQRIEINEEEASWVRQVYSWVLDEGVTTTNVVRKLNSFGIKTRKGGGWIACTVRNLLTHSIYSGTAYYNRSEAVEPGRRRRPGTYPKHLKSTRKFKPQEQWIPIHVPAIVTEEEQARAREILRSNRLNSPRKTKYEYLLRRLVVCGECGCRMGCQSHSNKRGDVRYPYYTCNRRPEETGRAEKCRARLMRSDWLDEAVWSAIKGWLQKPDILRAELNTILSVPDPAGNQFSREWNRLEAMIGRYERQETRIVDAYQTGIIEMKELKDRKESISSRTSEAKKRLEELSEARKMHLNAEHVLADIEEFAVSLRSGLESLSFEEKRKVMELLVERIVVKGREVTIEHVVPLQGRFSVLNLDCPQGLLPDAAQRHACEGSMALRDEAWRAGAGRLRRLRTRVH